VRVLFGRGILLVLYQHEANREDDPAKFAKRRDSYEHVGPWNYHAFPATSPTRAPNQWLGFGYYDEASIAGANNRTSSRAGWSAPTLRFVRLALWFPLIAFAVLRVVRALVWRRSRRRITRGLCPACGYNIQATPDRCPECGAVPTASRREDTLPKSATDEHVHGV
jgi:hypothetical protein